MELRPHLPSPGEGGREGAGLGVRVPWEPTEPVAPEAFDRVRRRMIFDCCKWDPQVEDVATLAPFPLLLRREA